MDRRIGLCRQQVSAVGTVDGVVFAVDEDHLPGLLITNPDWPGVRGNVALLVAVGVDLVIDVKRVTTFGALMTGMRPEERGRHRTGGDHERLNDKAPENEGEDEGDQDGLDRVLNVHGRIIARRCLARWRIGGRGNLGIHIIGRLQHR